MSGQDGASFGASATLQVSVDSGSLREAKAELEDELGDVTVTPTVGGGAGASSAASPDGGTLGGNDMGTLVSLAEEQRDILDDLLDEAEDLNLSTGGGGPGAGPGAGPLGVFPNLSPSGSNGIGRGPGGLITAALTLSKTDIGGSGLAPEDGPAINGGLATAFGQELNNLFNVSNKPAPEGEAPIDQIINKFESTQPSDVSETFSADDLFNVSDAGGDGLADELLSGLDRLNIDVDEALSQLENTDIPAPEWLDRLTRPAFEPGDTVTGPQGGTIRTTSDGRVVTGRGQETPNFVTTDRGTTRRVDTRDQIIPDRGASRRERSGDGSGGGGETTVNVEANVNVDAQGVSEREIDKKLDEATEKAKKQVKADLRRQFVGNRTGI